MSSAEVVYVLGSPDSLTVKIGTTANLRTRVAAIQRMSPVPLEALWVCPGGRELEMRLHQHFKEFRSHGEWFAFRRNPVQLIQWAVEDRPWLRSKVSLKKSPQVRDPEERRDSRWDGYPPFYGVDD